MDIRRGRLKEQGTYMGEAVMCGGVDMEMIIKEAAINDLVDRLGCICPENLNKPELNSDLYYEWNIYFLNM